MFLSSGGVAVLALQWSASVLKMTSQNANLPWSLTKSRMARSTAHEILMPQIIEENQGWGRPLLLTLGQCHSLPCPR
jgi:hypothetical protein